MCAWEFGKTVCFTTFIAKYPHRTLLETLGTRKNYIILVRFLRRELCLILCFESSRVSLAKMIRTTRGPSGMCCHPKELDKNTLSLLIFFGPLIRCIAAASLRFLHAERKKKQIIGGVGYLDYLGGLWTIWGVSTRPRSTNPPY